MEISNITLKNQHYRYSIYPNPNTEQWGVFLLGNLQEIESVDFFSQSFSETLNVLTVELPGTGMTSHLPAKFTILDQAKFLKNLIDSLGLERAHILAFSYSVPVALEFCLMYEGAISLSMCGGMAGIPDESREDTMAILAAALRDRAQFAEEFIKGLTVADKHIPLGNVIARSAKQKAFKYTAEQIRCFCENTIRILAYKPSDLSLIKIPCLLFTGELDPYVKKIYASQLADELYECKLIHVKNADHLVHLEHKEKTADLMIRTAKRMIYNDSMKIASNSYKFPMQLSSA